MSRHLTFIPGSISSSLGPGSLSPQHQIEFWNQKNDEGPGKPTDLTRELEARRAIEAAALGGNTVAESAGGMVDTLVSPAFYDCILGKAQPTSQNAVIDCILHRLVDIHATGEIVLEKTHSSDVNRRGRSCTDGIPMSYVFP
jgi:hypothetical protein